MTPDLQELSAADLSALLCSKVCHDIISPVGAITNGLELLEEDGDASMRDMAQELIQKSANTASAKLKFARIAYGAAGSAGAEIDTGDAESVAIGYMQSEKADLKWTVIRQLLPKNQVKLILNMILMAINCVPRGGLISVSMHGDGVKPSFEVKCEGRNARIPDHLPNMARGFPGESPVDAHSVQPYYAGVLARLIGVDISFSIDGETVTISAS